MNNTTPLEKAVLEMLLDGDHPILAKLRKQMKGCSVTKREFSGVGFFTTFKVSSDVEPVPSWNFAFGDVVAEINGLKHGAGFVLFVRNGLLDMLEGYTFDEPWPSEVRHFKLSYFGGGQRDWTNLREILPQEKL